MKVSKAFRVSIFLRLLLAFLVGGVLINEVLFRALRGPLPPAPPRSAPQNVGPDGAKSSSEMVPGMGQRHGRRVLFELAKNPTLDTIEAIKKRDKLEIYYEAPGKRWKTALWMPPWETIRSHAVLSFIDDPSTFVGPGYMAREGESEKMAVFYPPNWMPNPFKDPGFVILLVIRVALIVLLCYLFVVWQLRPIRWLEKGARAVGRGDLSYRVPVKHSSEFDDLGIAFNEMTERLSRLIKSREQLMANISHELRSPLTRIKLAVELSEDEERKKELQEDIYEMEKMIDEILESYRMTSEHGALKKEKYNISGALEELVKRYEDRKPGVRFVSESKAVEIEADRERIRRVLTNVIENALKYSPPDAKPVEVAVRYENRYVVIEVIDFGTGIPVDQLELVFEPFYRVDASRRRETGGVGLGLSLCQKIVAAHGGFIRALRNEEKGTIIRIALPAEEEANPKVLTSKTSD